jgi:hypothetical protein
MLFTIYYNVIFVILNIDMDSTYARKYYILVYFHPQESLPTMCANKWRECNYHCLDYKHAIFFMTLQQLNGWTYLNPNYIFWGWWTK